MTVVYQWCECGNSLFYGDWLAKKCRVCLRLLTPERDPADDTFAALIEEKGPPVCVRCGEPYMDDRTTCEICRGMDPAQEG